MNEEYFEMSLTGSDISVLQWVLNRGIDSRLTAFLESEFNFEESFIKFNKHKQLVTLRLICNIAMNEMEILLRRLNDFQNEVDDLNLLDAAYSLESAIIEIQYGHEIV